MNHRRIDTLEPLAVTPRQACQLLGVGMTRLYELLAAGELVSYVDGVKSRRITMESIRQRVARLAAAGGQGTPPRPTERKPTPRKGSAP